MEDRSPSGARIRKPVRKLLVVSDDLELFLFAKSELESQRVESQFQMDCRYSSRNSSPLQMIAAGVTEMIDLKNEETVTDIISKYDLVLSVHCVQIFPRRLVENLYCINIHPGLNPYNRGMFSHAFSILRGCPAGATLHVIDEEIDHGDIIAQEKIEISPSDTSLEVMRKAREAEKRLLRSYLHNIIEGNYEHHPPSGPGTFNKIKDFRALCALDLASVGTLKEHIDLLRATTYGSHKAAYFHGNDGNKYFVGIALEKGSSS